MDNTAGYIELHFYTKDGSHTMDAEAFNRCVYEYLGIIQEITSKYHVQVKVEAEAIEEGGIRQWLRINLPARDEFKKQFIMTLLVSIVTAPITTSISSVTDRCIEKVFTSAEISSLKEEKMKAELEYQIAWYNNEVRKLSDSINSNLIVKKRSNFYESVKICSKINEIEFIGADEKRNPYDKIKVPQVDFDKYILVSDDLEPKEIPDAVIEIISPVLKKGKYKWTGIYNGEVIQFSLKSMEFKTLVQTGDIAFKNGTSIQCELNIKRKLDPDGNEQITGYEVMSVDATFDNENPIETPEGRRKRRKKEEEKRQLELKF